MTLVDLYYTKLRIIIARTMVSLEQYFIFVIITVFLSTDPMFKYIITLQFTHHISI